MTGFKVFLHKKAEKSLYALPKHVLRKVYDFCLIWGGILYRTPFIVLHSIEHQKRSDTRHVLFLFEV